MTTAETKGEEIKKSKPKDNSRKGNFRKILSKLSGAFMLPISVMSIAGLFLGVGATISSQLGSYEIARIIGEFIKLLGDPVFGAMPLLFAAAFVVAFTDEAGIGVFAAIIGYLIFSAIQAPFIKDVKDTSGNLIGYDILWMTKKYATGVKQVVGSSLGFKTLQTSVFAGILIGVIVSYLYDKLHTIKLPTVFSFFGGKRFVSLVTIISMIPLTFFFLLVWPWVGIGLSYFGNSIGKVPYGFESFIFGFIERSLIPFGLHHVFYAPLWWTQAGGDLASAITEWQKSNTFVTNGEITKWLTNLTDKPDKWVGDSYMAVNVAGLPFNTLTWTKNGSTEPITMPVYKFIASELGIKLGRFLQGKYSFMILGLPGAAVAMILAAPKENRKVAAGTVIPAALTAMITGVTEPIEFTFLFLAPWLFWGFHAFFCALAFMLANLLGVHIGMTFSGGIMDLIIYGIIPVLKGTNFWWSLVIGAAYFPIYFLGFFFFIKKFNLATPGRGETVKLFTKKDFQEKQDAKAESKKDTSTKNAKEYAMILALGGSKNILNTNNCASRLRYDIKDRSLVNEAECKAAGAVALKWEGDKHVQVIIGPAAEQMNANIRKILASGELDDIVVESKEHKVETEKVESMTGCSKPGCETKCDCHTEEPVMEEKMEVQETPVAEVVEEVQPQPVQEAPVTPSETATMADTKWVDESNDLDRPVEFFAPAIGEVIPLSQIPDETFANKYLGDGVAIKLKAEKKASIWAPVSGTLETVFPTKHAYGITTDEGIKVLLHIGVDTVTLNGEGFETKVKQGKKIKAGDLLCTVDVEHLSSQNKVSDLIVIILNESEHKHIIDTALGEKMTKRADKLMLVK
ncbi:glucose PTS transporter subunit IIA [Mycoplasmopsis caviae]|uniref:Glucose PTS transporter subunit IIA n=1 Tax=Mycoplasmopsis caviae TaxID=55603 RepID=A0A3P8KMI7_9BACT|nr:PTS transporter subunit IIABC [Mycoplasmopsis caviae]UUD35186.1 glucose PTS transporter subunit IIA [Mycoplasmopsis caviae]VDR42018.1 PTS system, glucose/glucosamine/beta-glucoside-specific, IICBA component [Mycoplasmopsis caviae]VDR42492.1 PTS system, glucose/glucosamine/beta-glucoside-specific, IICBA component [Mycoplasmopsis caviae]